MEFINLNGPIIANTVYVENQMVARDVGITLPEITPQTAELKALGTLTMPMWSLLDNLEMTITKIGIDMGLRSMITPKPLPMEARWIQAVTDAAGITREVGCKAFVRGIPTKVPGFGLTPGETTEAECTYTLYRYQLIVDGAELLLIDKLAGIVRINGQDYTAGIHSML